MGRPISLFLQAKVLHRGQNNLPPPSSVSYPSFMGILGSSIWDHRVVFWDFFGTILGSLWDHFGSGTLMREENLDRVSKSKKVKLNDSRPKLWYR